MIDLGLLVNSRGEFLFYCLFCPVPSHLFGTLNVNIVNGNLILNKVFLHATTLFFLVYFSKLLIMLSQFMVNKNTYVY